MRILGFSSPGSTQPGLDGSKCQRAVATTSPSLDFDVAISLDSMGSGLQRDRLSEMVRARAEAHSGVSDRGSISTHQRSPSLKMISISTQRWTKSMVIPALTKLSNPWKVADINVIPVSCKPRCGAGSLRRGAGSTCLATAAECGCDCLRPLLS